MARFVSVRGGVQVALFGFACIAPGACASFDGSDGAATGTDAGETGRTPISDASPPPAPPRDAAPDPKFRDGGDAAAQPGDAAPDAAPDGDPALDRLPRSCAAAASDDQFASVFPAWAVARYPQAATPGYAFAFRKCEAVFGLELQATSFQSGPPDPAFGFSRTQPHETGSFTLSYTVEQAAQDAVPDGALGGAFLLSYGGAENYVMYFLTRRPAGELLLRKAETTQGSVSTFDEVELGVPAVPYRVVFSFERSGGNARAGVLTTTVTDRMSQHEDQRDVVLPVAAVALQVGINRTSLGSSSMTLSDLVLP